MKSYRFVLALLLLGCSSHDPFAGSHEPLASGVEMLTFYDKTYGVPGTDDANVVRVDVLSAQKRGGFGIADMPVGTKVRVVEDAEAKGGKPDRTVKALVLEGKLEGETVALPRERLRPIAK